MNIGNKILVFGGFLFFASFGFTQDFDNYKELSSIGKIPSDFLTLANDNFEQDKIKISEEEKRHKRKLKEQFYLESNFSISEFLKSGSILFNDPVSNYLNEIYDNIKVANPFLKNENIRFYTCKSTIINAYATHSGIIFLNMGLIAKIETEDELAYIMCHEISHYIENHSINQYTFNDKIDSDNGSYRKASWEKKMFSKSNYSQKHEMIADSLGVIMYSNTKYCINSPIDALGNLKSYNSPFPNILNVQKSFFENNYISFPSMTIISIDSIEVEDYSLDEELSTHPDIDYRIDEISDQLKLPEFDVDSIKTTTTKNKLQKIAQYEMPHLFIEKGMTMHALYSVSYLLEENPKSTYLNKMLCEILYAISQNSTCSYYFPDQSEISEFKTSQRDYYRDLKYSCADIQQLYLFFSNLSNEQKNALAITKLWSFISEYTAGDDMMLRLRDLTKMKLSYYPKSNSIESLIAQDTAYAAIYANEKSVSKAEIKKLRDSYSEEVQENITISNRISKNPSTTQTGDENSVEISKNETNSEDSDDKVDETSSSDDVYNTDESGKKGKKGKKEDHIEKELGKVIFVTPEFRKFDLRKKHEYNYQASEKALSSYQKKISDNAKLLKIDHVMLTTLNINSEQTDQINDIGLINTFVDERNNNSPWTISSKKEEIQNLASKYDADKIAFVGTYTFHMATDVGMEIYKVIMSIFLPPVLPFTLWSAITPEFRTFTYVLLYDISTEKIDYYEVEYMRMKGNEGVINTTMYYSFMKIKNL